MRSTHLLPIFLSRLLFRRPDRVRLFERRPSQHVAVAGSSSSDASSSDADGDADSPDASDAASPVATAPVTDVCSNTAKTICAYLETCSPEAAANSWASASASECEPRFRESCLASYPKDAEVRKDDADEYQTCLASTSRAAPP